jgi:hypothetical protein
LIVKTFDLLTANLKNVLLISNETKKFGCSSSSFANWNINYGSGFTNSFETGEAETGNKKGSGRVFGGANV